LGEKSWEKRDALGVPRVGRKEALVEKAEVGRSAKKGRRIWNIAEKRERYIF